MNNRNELAARMAEAARIAASQTFLGVPAPRVLSIDPDGTEVLRVSDEDHAFLLSPPGLLLMQRVLLERDGKIPPQAYGVTGTQAEKEEEVRCREIILATRPINDPAGQNARNDMAARAATAAANARVVDAFQNVRTNRAARRERETEMCGAPLRLETIGDWNYWQDLIDNGEAQLETPDVLNEEDARFIRSEDAQDLICEGLGNIPHSPLHEEYQRVGSAVFLTRPAAEHQRLLRFNEERRAAIIARVLLARHA